MKSIELIFGKSLRFFLKVNDVNVELNCNDTLELDQIIFLLKHFGDVYTFDFDTREYIKA